MVWRIGGTVPLNRGRTRLFEVKARLAAQCAKGLRLIEKVMKLTEPEEKDGEAEWTRETLFLVHTWFEEQEKEWYFAGKTFAVSMDTQLEQAHSREEAMETYNRGFALIMKPTSPSWKRCPTISTHESIA